ncbi:tyrosine-type recombinase/integrase [Phenylobacterium sp.]|mgnify:CR=1 FL=1|uniref:tyrosine-type recombinase/integrase n=1 Tax=Phenylobacterium sp. TaxID=1871053 RepID=UPI002FDF7E5F
MKHVKQVRGADGSTYLYLRRKGVPPIRLPDGLAPAALRAHVEALLAQRAPPPAPPAATLGAALRAYELESPDFRGLAASTQYEYRLMLKEFEEDLGKVPVAAFTPAYVDRLKALWARRGHRAANLRLQVLKNVLKPCLIAGTLKRDPFPLVGQVRRPRALGEPHRIWSDEVLATVIEAALAARRPGLARAVAIARYTGARRGDLVRIPRTARREGRFRFHSGKRGVHVDIPEDPALAGWLESLPGEAPVSVRRRRRITAGEAPVVTTTLVFNVAGLPYSEDGLGQELAKLVAVLHAAGRLDSDRYDLHGLRHTRGVELALAGCSDAEGAAMMGHQSAHSFTQYRRQADRSRLSDAAARRVAEAREEAFRKVENGKSGKK